MGLSDVIIVFSRRTDEIYTTTQLQSPMSRLYVMMICCHWSRCMFVGVRANFFSMGRGLSHLFPKNFVLWS